MATTVPLIIGGKMTKSATENTIVVHNAAGDRVAGYAEAADVQSATEAVVSAENAFTGWSKTGVSTRREFLLKAAKNFDDTQAQLMESLQEETSCTKQWAAANIAGARKSLQQLACSITAVSGKIPLGDDPSMLSLVFQVPLGAVLVIAPYVLSVLSMQRCCLSDC